MSLARATSFNRTNVTMCFAKLSNVLFSDQFETSRIWNMDETGVLTLLHPRRILAQKGAKQFGSITSEDRGEIITVAMNAQGNSRPTMFLLPEKHVRDHFLLKWTTRV
ncbi:hypothetical protein JTB14_028827 [Gonioctena quinquepunctata]|nr:hypothetical protein JTB14_028827 [Gonioctena quinquepunctata]